MHESVDPVTIRDDLASRYPVSRRFLDKLMPIIEEICSDMAEQRPRLLELVEEAVRRQAETEGIVCDASKRLEHLRALNRSSGLVSPGSSRRHKSVRSQKTRAARELPAKKAV